MERYLVQLNSLFSKYQEIKLVYLFGSQINNKQSLLSDYDFAVYFNPDTSLSRQKDIVLELISEISAILKSDKVDLIVLNKALSPLLKYNIIRGSLIYQQDPYKILVEPAIYNEYFDFKTFTQRFTQ